MKIKQFDRQGMINYLQDHDRAYTVQPITTYAALVNNTTAEDELTQQAQILVNRWNRDHLYFRAELRQGWLIMLTCRYLASKKKFVTTPQGIDYQINFEDLDNEQLVDRYLRLRSFDELAAQVNQVFGGEPCTLPIREEQIA